MVDGHEKELGDFSLEELEAVKGAFGLGIERDEYFGFNLQGLVMMAFYLIGFFLSFHTESHYFWYFQFGI